MHVADGARREASALRLRLLQLAVELGEMNRFQFLDAGTAEMRPHVVRRQLLIAFQGLRRDLRRGPALPAIEKIAERSFRGIDVFAAIDGGLEADQLRFGLSLGTFERMVASEPLPGELIG